MAFDSSRLVSQITIKGSLPEGRFQPQELLDFAYDAMLAEIVPIILSCYEEYFVRKIDLPIVPGQAYYDIPTRAIGQSLREVKVIRGTKIDDIQRTNPEDIDQIASGSPQCFYLEGTSVVLWPTPSAAGETLRLSYFFRPNKFVPVSEATQITAINGNIVTVSVPTGWAISNLFDLVRGRPHYDVLGFDLAAIAVDTVGGAITFAAPIPNSLSVGDYVTLAEETPFPCLPVEGNIALIQCAVTAALESLGDAAASVSAQKAEMQKNMFRTMLSTRILGAPKELGNRVL